uniref:Putative secreted peptide n=1 Tax=Anopheles braziliensis TaxID=58242 RepID=A0A2M3ZRS2_9DIPT
MELASTVTGVAAAAAAALAAATVAAASGTTVAATTGSEVDVVKIEAFAKCWLVGKGRVIAVGAEVTISCWW